MAKSTVRKKKTSWHLSTFLLLLIIVLVGLTLYTVTHKSLKLRSRGMDDISEQIAERNMYSRWLDNDRQNIRYSIWFTEHGYGDCPRDNDRFWPELRLDCLIGDQSSGPSEQDKTIVTDPEGLYYKHLTPGDYLKLLPRRIPDSVRGWFRRLVDRFSWSSGLGGQTELEYAIEQNPEYTYDQYLKELQDSIETNPAAYAGVSVDSLYIGLEKETEDQDGRSGKTVRSVSLMVHPLLERQISRAISTRERSRLLYQQFIEGAVGSSVAEDDVHELYMAALDRCGRYAASGDQSGLGVKKEFGGYVAVVQLWAAGDFSGDCNIHVVKKP